jgi:glycosyltransferase involved in cell wall biosynthesis
LESIFLLKETLSIVIITDTYAESMGYAGSRLPAAFAKVQNAEVHLVTAGLPAYYQMTDYAKTFDSFQRSKIPVGEVRSVEGFKVHYIGHKAAYGGIRLVGLKKKLAELNPNIVQLFSHTGWSAIDAARFQRKLGYRLFTGNHSGKIVYAPAQMELATFSTVRIKEFLKRGLPGRYIASRTVLCYGATQDCSDVATEFLGVPKSKIKTTSLGVETEIFHPVKNQQEKKAAQDLRNQLGVRPNEIMCVYTGKMTEEKNALLLATAVAELRQQGHAYRSVFYGAGPQADVVSKVQGAIVHPFVHYRQLGDVYRAADIAVWPTQITTSTLDAAACGIPIVVNDQILANERYEGNGLTYRLNDLEDLKRVLLQLKEVRLRKTLGDEGARKMREEFSWKALAQLRIDDYMKALGR